MWCCLEEEEWSGVLVWGIVLRGDCVGWKECVWKERLPARVFVDDALVVVVFLAILDWEGAVPQRYFLIGGLSRLTLLNIFCMKNSRRVDMLQMQTWSDEDDWRYSISERGKMGVGVGESAREGVCNWSKMT